MKNLLHVLVFSCALVVSSVVIAVGLSHVTKDNRTVTVRGLSEKEVPADMAVWRLSFSLGGNNLPSLQREIIQQTEIVTDFLKAHGLSDADFSVLSPSITDTSVDLYIDSSKRSFVYVAKQTVLVRSQKVASVKKASEDTLELVGKGISVRSDYDSKVNYEFNGLNQIKPEMIALATENAREAAEQFAHDSHSKVGKILSASQGLFSIEDAAPGLEELKHVRVVTTVVYALAD
ncbi:MAG: SIMPL domain-containing protein [Treponema sp.]|nr:SIMPL domain-containing protein [Treponema sp.]